MLLLPLHNAHSQEWWNSPTLADYWKRWNIPVHAWLLRTVFFPLMRRKVKRYYALLVVFMLSAIMHELAVAVPLRMLRGYAAVGMMLQARMTLLVMHLVLLLLLPLAAFFLLHFICVCVDVCVCVCVCVRFVPNALQNILPPWCTSVRILSH